MRHLLERAVKALEKLANMPHAIIDKQAFDKHRAFIWDGTQQYLHPVEAVQCVPLELLYGVTTQKNILYRNTLQLQQGYGANNCLLWGARGTGKSALVKAIHAAINAQNSTKPVYLIEVQKDDLLTLPLLIRALASYAYTTIIYCDDLAFDEYNMDYKALKTSLEGGITGFPKNIVFYATSNRKHLIKRSMQDNQERYELSVQESIEETVSLSDRFGLWLSFYPINQDDYFCIIQQYIDFYNIDIHYDVWRAAALEWSMTRGGRSGRVAWQFIQDLAARHHHNIL